MQNPEHFDGLFYVAVEDDVRRYDETANPRPKIVAALAGVWEADMQLAPVQDGINQAIGGGWVVRRDVGSKVVKVGLGLLGQPWLDHAEPDLS